MGENEEGDQNKARMSAALLSSKAKVSAAKGLVTRSIKSWRHLVVNFHYSDQTVQNLPSTDLRQKSKRSERRWRRT